MIADDLNTKPRHHRPHITTIPNESISTLTGYNGLTLTVMVCILFLTRFYLFEGFLFKRVYGKTWTTMDAGTKRGFVNHHISGGIKIIVLIVGVYPWSNVLFGKANLHTPMGKMAHPTMGDVLVILTQLFASMYIFELLYRDKLSPVAVAHHIGAIIIAQTAVILSLDLDHQEDATLEFLMCLVWGAWDVIAEFWPNLAMILYRPYYNNHALLSNIFLGASLVTIVGTTAETIMVMTLFGQVWSRWELSFKIVTPILHIIFTIAQIHGSRILFILHLKQKRLAAEENARADQEMGLSMPSGPSKLSNKVGVTENEIEGIPDDVAPSAKNEVEAVEVGNTNMTRPDAAWRSRLPKLPRLQTILRRS